ncbi:D-Ala-D-Ala carboxypeptidase family metallohydrolase [Microbulbifer variabilis]
MFQNGYITVSESDCRCCGDIILKKRFGKPMIINSGYRCPAHNAW